MKKIEDLFDENLMFERINYGNSLIILKDLIHVKEMMDSAKKIVVNLPMNDPLMLKKCKEKISEIDRQIYFVNENIKITLNVLGKHESLVFNQIKLLGENVNVFNN